ncbi:MAG TPA: multicopper oxidase domain-containing protein, partial [Allocoleopsis sp.]
MKATIIVTAVTPTTISTPTPTPPQNISPTFACLGACPITPSPHPTSTSSPAIATPTPTPAIVHNPCEETTVQAKNTNDIEAMRKGNRRGGDDNDRGSRRSSNDSLLQFLISFLQLLFQLLGLGTSPAPQPIPTAAPTPVPTNIPTPLLTTEPSPTPCPGSPTPTGKISIDDLKYHPGTEALRHFDLIAEPISATQWTYNSDLSQNKTPGPEWRVVQGDHVQVSFVNHLAEATTVHWHGVRVEASQDGIPGITQNSIPPGGTYQYDFTVPDAGTYWFHPHQNSQNQVPKGLIGTIVVEPRIPAADDAFQEDHTIVYNNTVKTATNTQLKANPGERVRLRIIDGREPDFSGTPLRIALVGAPFKVFAIDGQKINQPQQISSQLIEMGMGNRVDLDFIMPATGTVKLLESQNLQNFTIGAGADPAIPNLNTLPTFSYLNYGVKTADPRLPKTTFDAEYTLNLGADLSINGKLFPN